MSKGWDIDASARETVIQVISHGASEILLVRRSNESNIDLLGFIGTERCDFSTLKDA